ncbi:MAG: DUF4160 domain-containing protein [Parachlamydiaceae bacterium]
MPEISRFFGIVVKMFSDEHNPPHFHANYGEYRATFSIETGQMIQGDMPPNKSALVTAWAIIHREDLISNWQCLEAGSGAQKINPLH